MRFSRWEALLETLERPLVFYDTETTHLQPDRAAVIEFGAAVYGPARMLEEGAPRPDRLERSLVPGLLFTFSARVNPGPEVLASADLARSSRVHGITAADLRDLTYSDADRRRDSAEILAAGTVCGFNSAEYDDVVLLGGHVVPQLGTLTQVDVLRVVRAVVGCNPVPELDLQGEHGPRFDLAPGGFSGVPITVMWETAELTRDTLSALSVALLGVPHHEAHGTLPDSMRSAESLAALMELWPKTCPGDLAGLEALTLHPDGFSGGQPAVRRWDSWDRMLKLESWDTPAGAAEGWIWQRGKHRGCALAETDKGYLHWLVNKSDFGEQTKAIVRSHLRTR